MDDSCAVCAEPLEWVAYGACGHREVCSTCVSRLRFICEDRRCCICKTESDVVFVTKALGDYTTTISDFSVFPSDSTEGRNGSYWYHEDTGAYFDDSDHYKMVKAMCRLSCSVCDKEDQGGNDGSRRKGKFRNIEQLKSHLFHRHKLFMCSLCLEGRKIFICEQKLYTRAQLNQHINTGDSEVDGSESERGGFMGHPICEFCRKPFYGDNELYSHMSTEHYTCHICQRQHPGQFEYYKNYDDLEMHFRSLHFLCENEGCLAKKFVVFTSESEMKRHNALEHGGHMSRSKRNAVLQIPTSFRYRRSNEQDNRRGRGRVFRPDYSEDQFSEGLDTTTADYTNHDPSSSAQSVSDRREVSDIDEIVNPFEVLATAETEGSSRYREALGQSSRNIPLEESSFPPLPVAPTSTQQKLNNEGPGKNTMASRLRRRNKGTINVLNSAKPWSATNHGLTSSSSTYPQARTIPNHGVVSSSSSASSSLTKAATTNGPIPSSHASSAQARTIPNHGLVSSSIPVSSPQTKASTTNGSSSSYASSAQARTTPNQTKASITNGSSSSYASSAQARTTPSIPSSSPLTKAAITNGPTTSSYASLAQARPATGHGLPSASSGSSSWNTSSTSRVSHSVSAPNLVERGSLDSSVSEFPPVFATQKKPTSSQLKVENVHTANKSLVERIQSALEFDENKYTAFKDISAEFRQGVIGSAEYLSYVEQFGLSHLVLELARLCPDAKKQRDLLETYNASVRRDTTRENDLSISGARLKGNKGSNKGKGKFVEGADSSSKDTLADNIIDTVKKLQATYRPLEEEVEVLSKDGYRRSNGSSKATVPAGQLDPSSTHSKSSNLNGRNDIQSAGSGSSASSGGGGGGKQKKKTSKFHRARLGDGYDRQSDEHEETTNLNEDTSEGLPVRGVWRNGGGQKLVALTQKDPAY